LPTSISIALQTLSARCGSTLAELIVELVRPRGPFGRRRRSPTVLWHGRPEADLRVDGDRAAVGRFLDLFRKT
jgi:hypothetical protein